MSKPNLLIIHTDEHNFRTLGCYRDLMTEDQAFVWGPGVKVDTPHIDSLARDGAICDSYYSSSPVCSPSRASFVSGLYPIATDVYKNDIPLKEGLITFAEVLKNQGYATSYLGKWHLGGEAKPGFAPEQKFGFEDNRYMWNRGHWKKLGLREDDTPYVAARNNRGEPASRVGGADEKSFTTDWLTTRTLEIIERDQNQPFCIMVSIPDPHGPNTVRELNQGQMQRYFGMVKCIDDNVGRILADLEAGGLDQNTIVIFTADHGDLMGEHRRHNKGMPYEGSAKIPFVIRWPEKIAPGKVVNTAYTTVDFGPTILGIMGIEEEIPNAHGLNAAAAFLSDEKVVDDDRIVYMTTSASQTVMAVNRRYKLVLSQADEPWLFDLHMDPDELVNVYSNPEYKEVAEKIKAELIAQMARYNEPALRKGRLIY